MTRLSNDVPTTETIPRIESGRLSADAGPTVRTGGTFAGAGVVFVAGGCGVSPGCGTGAAGGPATRLESRAAALSTFADPLAQAMDARPTAIERFLITFSLRARRLSPRHCLQ
jgi:hypothetical protein